jgi:hypothetical protein
VEFSENAGALGHLFGRRDFVEHLYKEASLDLDKDLVRLNRTERIRPDSGAIDYMMHNYVPKASLKVPLIAVQ